MAGGGLAVAARGGQEFEAKITPIVIISCIMTATGGLFGYDRWHHWYFAPVMTAEYSEASFLNPNVLKSTGA
ncbi:hypothetical protein Tco_0222236 [Tanacetum coccineum]